MKVPDQSDIVSLVEMTASSSAITISTHIRPDGDAVGSSVAMLHFLLAQGKDAYVILPHHAPETVGFLLESVPEGRIIVH